MEELKLTSRSAIDCRKHEADEPGGRKLRGMAGRLIFTLYYSNIDGDAGLQSSRVSKPSLN